MKLRASHLLMLALSATSANAQQVSETDAQAIARQFFTRQAAHHAGHAAAANPNPTLAYTAVSHATPDFYVFHRSPEGDDGFVIISADASTPNTILGYVPNGHFDLDKAPEGFRWWMETIQTYGVSSPSKSMKARTAGRHTVPPLIETLWNQNEPYNIAIPSLQGYSRLVTGCTATAMAQVMKYWEYPTRGIGSKTYSNRYIFNVTGGTWRPVMSANFAETTYDWAHMRNEYTSGNYTQQEADAVATLMYHAGVAEDAEYNFSSNGGTSADSRKSGKALIEHFAYDPTMLRGERDFYSDDEWENLLYTEVAEGRPVLYGGQSNGGGHAFIVHGYNAEKDLFDINWGWGGYCDGQFALTGDDALNPNGSGIGGSSTSDGYTRNQNINYHIIPAEGGQAVKQIGMSPNHGYSVSVNDNPITSYTVDRTHGGNEVTCTMSGWFYNYGFLETNIKTGIMFRNVANGQTYTAASNDLDLNPGELKSFYPAPSINTSRIPTNGVYEILPAFSTDGGNTWDVALVASSEVIPTLTVTGGAPPVAVELPYEVSDSQVQVGKTVSITPSPFYTGSVSWTSLQPTIASVDGDGVVTGVANGMATIVAEASGDENFLAGRKEFYVEVVDHIVNPLVATLSAHEIHIGETAQIVVPADFSGNYTVTAEPEGIVEVDADGTVHGVNDGSVTLMVTNEPTFDYHATYTPLTLHVKGILANTGGFDFTDYPTVGENNMVGAGNLTMILPVVNHANVRLQPARVYYSLPLDGVNVSGSAGYSALDSGMSGVMEVDLAKYASYMTIGKSYKVWFFSNEARTVPMNVPEITYTVVAPQILNLTLAEERVYGTICPPFTCDVPSGMYAYEVTAYYDEQLQLKKVIRMERNHSYVICGDKGQYQLSGDYAPAAENPTFGFMTGLQQSLSIPAGSYVVQSSSDLGFERTNRTQNGAQWTAYLTLPAEITDDLVRLPSLGGISTGIVNVPANFPTAAGIYTLDGRRHNHFQQGVNILIEADGARRRVVVE